MAALTIILSPGDDLGNPPTDRLLFSKPEQDDRSPMKGSPRSIFRVCDFGNYMVSGHAMEALRHHHVDQEALESLAKA
jgi:hypothetical protein